LDDALPFDPIAEAGRHWRARWDERAAPQMMAVTSIMRAQQLLRARMNEALEPLGMTSARYEPLMLLLFSRTNALSVGRMGTLLSVHPTTVTSLVDSLEKSGFVTRAPHPEDGRASLVSITERGREVALASTEALNAIRYGTAPLDAEELDGLTDVLRTLRVAAGHFGEPAT
jgi:DNA-binding MarR family transcriptional regulator